MLRRHRKLLLEELRQGVRHGRPAERVVVDVGSVAAQQGLVGQEAVFALVDRHAKPVAAANGRFNLEQKLAAYRKQAARYAADAARPVLGDLVKLKCREIDQRLNGGQGGLVGVANADPSADRAHARFSKARREFADRVRVKDAVRVDRDNNLGGGVLQCVANGACLAAVQGVAAGADADVREVLLRLEHPLIAVVGGAIVLRDDFEQLTG